jgi:MtaA/CmuA family methyltransferase
MAKQLVIDAIRGKRLERVPWVHYAGVHAAYLIGEKADKYLQDPNLIAKGVLYATERYKADGGPLVFDLSVEAMSMGCQAKWIEDNPPAIVGHPLVDKSLKEANLKIPTAKDGRWPVIVEAGKKVMAKKGDWALMGLFCGPLTLASHLRGVKIFTDVIKNKPLAKEIIDFAGRVGAESARIYRDIGCEVIAIVDPVASQIKPQTFSEFVTPACQEAIKVVRDAGLTSTFFICGDATKVLEEVCQVGTDGFAIDEQLNLNYVRDMALRYGVGFGGNLKLTLSLSLGIINPKEDAIVSLAAGGYTGYTFAPG